MATITKTYKETSATVSSFNSTWTVVMTGTNTTVSGSTFNFPFPTLTGKHTASNVTKKPYAFASLVYAFNLGAYDYSVSYLKNMSSPYNWAADTALSIPQATYPSGLIINTSNVFNSSNKTSKTVNVSATLISTGNILGSSCNPDFSGPSTGRYNASSTASWGNVFTVTLNAPPTFDSSNVTLTTPVYAGYTTATATISNLSAKYEGYITKAELKIGNQTASLTGTATNILSGGTLSIPLTASGKFTPTVTVTDSRGQTTTKQLAEITILPYVAPNVSFNVERTTDVGVPNDEGESAVITATLNYTDAVAHLIAPIITVKDPDNLSVPVITEWYSARETNGTFNLQNIISDSDWSNITRGVTIYCFVYNYKLTQDISAIDNKRYYIRTGSDPYEYTEVNNPTGNPTQQGWYERGVFDTQDSYQIELTPKDIDINNVSHSGTTITQTLGSAFYTVDFLAGGHGIAFGKSAIKEGFDCNMDAYFNKKVFLTHFAGVIQMFAGDIAPDGWLFCDGSAVSRTTYATLFAVIGTTYGSGDGSTTFNLPDMRSRMPIGVNNSYLPNGENSSFTTRSRNASGGYENGQVITHTHVIPSGAMTSSGMSANATHNHGTGGTEYNRFITTTADSISNDEGSALTGSGYKFPRVSADYAFGSRSGNETVSVAHTHTVPNANYTVPAPSGAVSAAGRNMPPFITINFIICTGEAL